MSLPNFKNKHFCKNQVLQAIVAENLSYSHVALPLMPIKEPEYILNSSYILRRQKIC